MIELEQMQQSDETGVGSYFVANYPPFSTWTPDRVSDALATLQQPAASDAAVGLYLHIPFCRQRCKFCYFRVYTDKNARDVAVYLDALCREIELYSRCDCLRGRTFAFVYFGGGTPSYLSSDQLRSLFDRVHQYWSWDNAREVTFECEPGTLKKSKLETIRRLGVTRLSLGVEHFDDDILVRNGRAHRSPEVFRAFGWAREVGFPQINIDLIAGMAGDCQSKWTDAVEKAVELDPDSVTIYQMEVPHNTLIAGESGDAGPAANIVSWSTKRAWVDQAFRRFEQAGYVVSSAYTVAKPTPASSFVYRDALWYGADMIGTGVASFSHVNGVHFQNAGRWEDYIEGLLAHGKLPLSRAYAATILQRLTREFILQLKLGRVEFAYFTKKYQISPADLFAAVLAQLAGRGYLRVLDTAVELTREGLLCVDALLPAFFEPEFVSVRYT